jgi:hypothetical protein
LAYYWIVYLPGVEVDNSFISNDERCLFVFDTKAKWRVFIVHHAKDIQGANVLNLNNQFEREKLMKEKDEKEKNESV